MIVLFSDGCRLSSVRIGLIGDARGGSPGLKAALFQFLQGVKIPASEISDLQTK